MTASQIRGLLKNVTIAVGAVITHHYGSKILDYKENKIASESQNLLENQVNEIKNNVDYLVERADNTDQAVKGISRCQTILKEALNANTPNEALDKVGEGSECLNEIIKLINTSNNFNFDLTPLYSFLDSLTLLEESALLHIIFFVIIGITFLNMLSALFANELIKYFDLENKHHYLKKFLMLRSKFQRYYFIFNSILIFIIIIVAITLNLIILI